MARQSVGSFTSSSNSSVDASFISLASSSSSASSSYEIESEVGREALREICCSALSRVLDFPDCQLETLLGFEEEKGARGDEDSGTNVARNIAARIRLMRQSIGSALSHRAHHRQGAQELKEETDGDSGIPTLRFGVPLSIDSQVSLLQLITHVGSFASREGLFRKPGSQSRVERLVAELGERELGEIVTCEVYKPHDFASALKQYFAELAEPLLLKRHMDAYLQASALSSPAHCLQLLTLLLPPSNRVILTHLLQMLAQVAAASQESKMDARNLALILAPTLFLASKLGSIPPESLEKLVSVLKYMIENSEEIFEVPTEVQVVADRYCKKKNRTQETDIPLELYTTSCKRVCPEEFHSVGKERALAEVASLFEYVQKMPDGPQKTHFLKRFESGGSTPLAYIKQPKSHRNKENTTPRGKFGFGSSRLSKRSQSYFKKSLKPGNLNKLLQECETPKAKGANNSGEGQQGVCNQPGARVKRGVLATNSPLVTDV